MEHELNDKEETLRNYMRIAKFWIGQADTGQLINPSLRHIHEFVADFTDFLYNDCSLEVPQNSALFCECEELFLKINEITNRLQLELGVDSQQQPHSKDCVMYARQFDQIVDQKMKELRESLKDALKNGLTDIQPAPRNLVDEFSGKSVSEMKGLMELHESRGHGPEASICGIVRTFLRRISQLEAQCKIATTSAMCANCNMEFHDGVHHTCPSCGYSHFTLPESIRKGAIT